MTELDPRKEIGAAEMIRRAKQVVEEDVLAIYADDEHQMSKLLDETHPGLRPQVVDIYREEIQALDALSQSAATLEELDNITALYETKVRNLYERFWQK